MTGSELEPEVPIIPPCPASPNCVSSAPGTDPEHFLAPLIYSGSLAEAKSRLLALLESMPRTRVTHNHPRYLHVECTSLLFRFVDDLEFWFESEPRLIHVRSASRVGHSDLGINRKRVEAIRTQFSR